MIDVLLATYNGEAYLPELLASLKSQTRTDWCLIVRDDGSTDGTISLIESWAKENTVKVRVLKDGRTRLGPCGNFSALLEASEAPYFMFCDQDDVWLPGKMALLLNAIRDVETRRGAQTPILAHSDLIIVDESLRPMHGSFWGEWGSHPSRWPSNRALILQNRVTGCALMGNGALRALSSPIPRTAAMHDWWVALVAVFAGELIELETPTVLYRQHGGNSVGAKSWKLTALFRRFLSDPFLAVKRTRSVISKTQDQASTFAERFCGKVDSEIIELCRAYASLRNRSIVERKLFFSRRKIWPNNLYRAGLFWLFV